MAAKKTSFTIETAHEQVDMFNMPRDALDALRRDASYSLAGGLSGDIWTLDQVFGGGDAKDVMQVTQVYEYPTIAPLRWDFKSVPVTCSEYLSVLAKQFPVPAAILQRMAGQRAGRLTAGEPIFVLYGSAAVWPLGPKLRLPKDFNFAYVGLDSLPAPERWLIIQEATNACIDVLQEMGADVVRQALTPGLITLVADWADPLGGAEHAVDVSQRLQISIDLRLYSSVSELLHTTGHLPVACDGLAAYTTALGAFEHSRRTIVADPIKGTANYENRICRHFQEGYAVTFPYMRTNAFKCVAVTLGSMYAHSLRVSANEHVGPLAFGELQAEGPLTDDREIGPMVDADRVTNIRMLVPMFLEHAPLSETHILTIIEQFADAPAQLAQDVGKLNAGGTWATVASASTLASYPVRPIPTLTEVRLHKLTAWVMARSAITACWISHRAQAHVMSATRLPISQWLERAPTLGTMFPADCRTIITEHAKATIQALTELGQLDIKGLFTFFKCSAADVTEIAAAAMRMCCAAHDARAHDARAHDARAHDARAATVIMAREKAVWDWLERVGNSPVAWWLPHRPVLVQSREQWYGENFCAWPKPAPMAERLAAAMAVAAARESPLIGITYNDTCPLCFEPVRRGELNTVTLRCGHIFHYSSPNCGGLAKWSRDCPQCRKH